MKRKNIVNELRALADAVENGKSYNFCTEDFSLSTDNYHLTAMQRIGNSWVVTDLVKWSEVDD